MEQPIKIKIKKQVEEIEKTESIIDEVSNETGRLTPLAASRTIWERIGEVCLCLLAGLTPLFFFL